MYSNEMKQINNFLKNRIYMRFVKLNLIQILFAVVTEVKIN